MKCPPCPKASPTPRANHPILFPSLYNPGYKTQELLKLIAIEAPHPFPPTLFKTSLSVMSYNSNSEMNAVMATLLRKISPRQASSFYKVPYRSIMSVTKALESIQEQQVTPLVENDNHQQIYRWVRKHILLPSGRGYYTDWELCQSVEEIIFLKSSCAAIQDNFGAPKTSIQRYLNVLFPSLKCSSLKHLWYLMRLGEIRNKTVRKTITEKIVMFELGQESYLLKD